MDIRQDKVTETEYVLYIVPFSGNVIVIVNDEHVRSCEDAMTER
jgi:hypothetical protein